MACAAGIRPRVNDHELWRILDERPSLGLHAAMYTWPAARLGPGWVLDLGCEYGFGGRLIRGANPGLRVVGVDCNGQALRLARRTQLDIDHRGLLADGGRLPFASGSLAGVYLINVLQLVEDAGAVLREARRVLVCGGVAVVGFTPRSLDSATPAGEHLLECPSPRLQALFPHVEYAGEIFLTTPPTGRRAYRLETTGLPWLALCSMG